MSCWSQQLIVPLYDDYDMSMQKEAYSSEHRFHTAMRPWNESQFSMVDLQKMRESDYVMPKRKLGTWKEFLWHSFLNTDWLPVNGGDGQDVTLGTLKIDRQEPPKDERFFIAVNPLFDFQTGWQRGLDYPIWRNTRGAEVRGTIGKGFAFYTSVRENQAVFPTYVSDNITNNKMVVPGQGWTKKFGTNGFDFTYCSAYLSFSPKSWFNAVLGYGKNFIGDGYRSLILSDNAFNYPYLKLTGNIWNIQYNCLYTQMIDKSTSVSSTIGYARKYVTMHYADWAVTNRLTLSFFDAIIWSDRDSTGIRGFEINYLNPILFLRPVEYTVGPSPDNAMMGATASYIFGKHTVLYGQFVLDEMVFSHFLARDGWHGNKQAYQIGVKTYDAFKIRNLFLQAEFNHVRPYMYTHYGQSQNYAHFNQALAHPWGANFWELVCRAQYNYKRVYLQYKLNYGLYGDDGDDLSAGHCGHNIFLNYQHYLGYKTHNELGHYVGQGIETHLLINDVVLSYLVNPSYKFNVFVEVMQRVKTVPESNTTDKTFVFNMGFRTSLERLYYDF